VTNTQFDDAPGDAQVLVAVLKNPEDLLRAQTQGWYRIPLAHAPSRIGADFLAFYQTGAFLQEERWVVRWIAPVRGYHLVTRRELIPEQPEHPRADERYYRVALGELTALPNPIPSRRLRRITFIRTTLGRLLAAQEINDLWIHTAAQEQLWQAMQEAGLADAVEHEYPLVDDLPYTADFAIFAENQRIALMVAGDEREPGSYLRERMAMDYALARGGWQIIEVDGSSHASITRGLAMIHDIRPLPIMNEHESL